MDTETRFGEKLISEESQNSKHSETVLAVAPWLEENNALEPYEEAAMLFEYAREGQELLSLNNLTKRTKLCYRLRVKSQKLLRYTAWLYVPLTIFTYPLWSQHHSDYHDGAIYPSFQLSFLPLSASLAIEALLLCILWYGVGLELGYKLQTRNWYLTLCMVFIMSLESLQLIINVVCNALSSPPTFLLTPLFPFIILLVERKYESNVAYILSLVPKFCVLIALLLCMVAAYTILGFQLFSPTSQEYKQYFSKFHTGFWNMLMVLNASDWPGPMIPALNDNRLNFLYFFVFVLVVEWGMVNLVLGFVYMFFRDEQEGIVRRYEENKISYLTRAFHLLDQDQAGVLTFAQVDSLLKELYDYYVTILDPPTEEERYELIMQLESCLEEEAAGQKGGKDGGLRDSGSMYSATGGDGSFNLGAGGGRGVSMSLNDSLPGAADAKSSGMGVISKQAFHRVIEQCHLPALRELRVKKRRFFRFLQAKVMLSKSAVADYDDKGDNLSFMRRMSGVRAWSSSFIGADEDSEKGGGIPAPYINEASNYGKVTNPTLLAYYTERFTRMSTSHRRESSVGGGINMMDGGGGFDGDRGSVSMSINNAGRNADGGEDDNYHLCNVLVSNIAMWIDTKSFDFTVDTILFILAFIIFFIDTTDGLVITYVAISVTEAIIKLRVKGRYKYVRTNRNLYDGITSVLLFLVLLICGLISHIIARNVTLLWLILFRTLLWPRNIILLNAFTSFRRKHKEAYRVAARTSSHLLFLLLIMFIMMLVMANVGSLLFGGVLRKTSIDVTVSSYGNQEYWPLNFNDLPSAFITMFVLLHVNNMHVITSGCVAAVGSWSQIFFYAWYACGVLLLLNIMIALFLNQFVEYLEALQEQEEKMRMKAAPALPPVDVEPSKSDDSAIVQVKNPLASSYPRPLPNLPDDRMSLMRSSVRGVSFSNFVEETGSLPLSYTPALRRTNTNPSPMGSLPNSLPAVSSSPFPSSLFASSVERGRLMDKIQANLPHKKGGGDVVDSRGMSRAESRGASRGESRGASRGESKGGLEGVGEVDGDVESITPKPVNDRDTPVTSSAPNTYTSALTAMMRSVEGGVSNAVTPNVTPVPSPPDREVELLVRASLSTYTAKFKPLTESYALPPEENDDEEDEEEAEQPIYVDMELHIEGQGGNEQRREVVQQMLHNAEAGDQRRSTVRDNEKTGRREVARSLDPKGNSHNVINQSMSEYDKESQRARSISMHEENIRKHMQLHHIPIQEPSKNVFHIMYGKSSEISKVEKAAMLVQFARDGEEHTVFTTRIALYAFKFYNDTIYIYKIAALVYVLLRCIERPYWSYNRENWSDTHQFPNSGIPKLSPQLMSGIKFPLLCILLFGLFLEYMYKESGRRIISSFTKNRVLRLCLIAFTCMHLLILIACFAQNFSNPKYVTATSEGAVLYILWFNRRSLNKFQVVLRILPRFLQFLSVFFLVVFIFAGFGPPIYQLQDIGDDSTDDDANKAYFNSFSDSVWSVFTAITSSSWPNQVMPSYREYRDVSIYFITFITLGTFGLLNILLVIVLVEFQRAAQLLADQQQASRQVLLMRAFEVLDEDCRGFIEYEVVQQLLDELYQFYNDFKRAGIPKGYAKNLLIDILDVDGDGKISMEDFLFLLDVVRIKLVVDVKLTYIEKHFPKLAHSELFLKTKRIVDNKLFDLSVDLFAACLLILSLSANYKDVYNPSSSSVAFTVLIAFVYNIEMLLKLATRGFYKYKRSFRNCVDMFITVGITLCLIGGVCSRSLLRINACTTVIKILLMVRFILLPRNVRYIYDVGHQISKLARLLRRIFAKIATLSIVFLCTGYLFVSFGELMFGGTMNKDSSNENLQTSQYAQKDYWALNFNDFVSGCMTLFTCLRVSDFDIIASGFSAVTTNGAKVYFTAWYLVGTLLFLNILKSFFLGEFLILFGKSSMGTFKRKAQAQAAEGHKDESLPEVGMQSNGRSVSFASSKKEINRHLKAQVIGKLKEGFDVSVPDVSSGADAAVPVRSSDDGKATASHQSEENSGDRQSWVTRDTFIVPVTKSVAEKREDFDLGEGVQDLSQRQKSQDQNDEAAVYRGESLSPMHLNLSTNYWGEQEGPGDETAGSQQEEMSGRRGVLEGDESEHLPNEENDVDDGVAANTAYNSESSFGKRQSGRGSKAPVAIHASTYGIKHSGPEEQKALKKRLQQLAEKGFEPTLK